MKTTVTSSDGKVKKVQTIISDDEGSVISDKTEHFNVDSLIETADLPQAKPRSVIDIMEVVDVNIRSAISLIDEFMELRKYDDDLTCCERNIITNSATGLNNRLMVINGIIDKDTFDKYEKRRLKILDDMIAWKQHKEQSKNGGV